MREKVSNLKHRAFEDFMKPGVTKEVAKLRHEHHEHRVVSNIHKIIEERKKIPYEFYG